MDMLIVLIVLLLLFGGGGLTYRSWGSGNPDWVRSLIWVLFALVVIAIVLNLLGVLAYPGARPVLR